MRVLVAEDDKNIREGLVEILEEEGYTTVQAADGAEALVAFRAERPDFVCLDVMMPVLSGYDVCKTIRSESPQTPIIFISAKSQEVDRVVGLEVGADDYICKPFGVREVVARVRAVSRRVLGDRGPAPGNVFVMGDLEVRARELRARRGDDSIDLSVRDVKLLELFFERRGEVVDRATIFDVCWGLDHVPNSRTLDQHISQLRKRIEVDAKNPSIIRTVHGAGYRYE